MVADITAIKPSVATYLTTWAQGSAQPNASSLNANAGATVNKEVTIPLNTANGELDIYNASGTVDVTVDVEGYLIGTANSFYTPVQPQRICDTRGTSPLTGSYAQCNNKTLSTGATLSVQVTGLATVPANATAVVLNLTSVDEQAAGYLTIYPTGQSLPLAAQINYSASAIDNNEVTVALGTGGAINMYNDGGPTDALLDVQGYYTSQASPPSTSFTYNGDGLRATATTSGSPTTNYTNDINNPIPAVIDDNSWYIIYGPVGPDGQQLPIEQINTTTGATYYLHHDNIGTTIAITDTTGHTVNTLNYDPYGNLEGQTGTITSPIAYSGAYQDPTGLDYLINRYYDPTTAQFLTRDPLQALTSQPYSYTNDNPVNYTDPAGLCASLADRLACASLSLISIGAGIAAVFFPELAPLLLALSIVASVAAPLAVGNLSGAAEAGTESAVALYAGGVVKLIGFSLGTNIGVARLLGGGLGFGQGLIDYLGAFSTCSA